MKRKKTLTPIEQEYKRLRKNALERARYWRKKGVEIPVPKKPKMITEAFLRNFQQKVEKAAEKAKRPTKAPIEQEYKRLRKNALERARYWRKKGVEIPVPKKPKRITEASLRNLQQKVEKEAEKAKSPTEKKKPRPTMEEIILRRIREIIDRGLASGDWEAYKASLARDIVEENLPEPGTPQRKDTLKRWADSLGGLDEAVNRFIFDSAQNLSGSAWQTILSIITGNNYFPDVGVSDFEDEFLE